MLKLTGRIGFLVLAVPFMLPAPALAQFASNPTQGCSAAPVDYADEQGLTPDERIRRMDRALTRSLNRYDQCQEPEDDKLAPRDTDPPAQAGGAAGTGEAAGEAAAEASSEADGGASGEAGSQTEITAGASGGERPLTAPGDISGDTGAASQPGTVSAGGGGAGQAGGVAGAEADDGFGAGAPSVAAGGISGDEPETFPAPPAGSSGSGPERPGTQAGQAGGPEDGTVAGAGPRVLQNGKLPEDIPSADNDSVLEAQIRQAAIDEPDPELKKKLWNEYRRYRGLPQVN